MKCHEKAVTVEFRLDSFFVANDTSLSFYQWKDNAWNYLWSCEQQSVPTFRLVTDYYVMHPYVIISSFIATVIQLKNIRVEHA